MNVNPPRILLTLAAVAVLCAATVARAADVAADEVLVENKHARVTRTDFEADLLRVPPESRAAFRADPKRVVGIVNNLLIVRSLAAQGRAHGLDRDPVLARQMQIEADRALFQAELAYVESLARAEFDARSAQELDAIAREAYVIDKARYQKPEEVSASHVLIDHKRRDSAAALALAQEVRARLMAGANFEVVAREVSEDTSVKENGGALGFFPASRMDPEFSKAAFALQKVGDLSEPVLSSFGYHIIRLDGRRPAEAVPFEQVKASILDDKRARFAAARREKALTDISHDPDMKINNAAIESLVNRVDPALLAPRRAAPAKSQ